MNSVNGMDTSILAKEALAQYENRTLPTSNN